MRWAKKIVGQRVKSFYSEETKVLERAMEFNSFVFMHKSLVP